VELVTATGRELLACANAGDLARVFALYSDYYLFTLWGGGTESSEVDSEEMEEGLARLANPMPLAEEKRFALVAVHDVRVLPDGRVIVIVRNNFGSSLALYVKSGDRYLVDWASGLLDGGTPTP